MRQLRLTNFNYPLIDPHFALTLPSSTFFIPPPKSLSTSLRPSLRPIIDRNDNDGSLHAVMCVIDTTTRQQVRLLQTRRVESVPLRFTYNLYLRHLVTLEALISLSSFNLLAH